MRVAEHSATLYEMEGNTEITGKSEESASANIDRILHLSKNWVKQKKSGRAHI